MPHSRIKIEYFKHLTKTLYGIYSVNIQQITSCVLNGTVLFLSSVLNWLKEDLSKVVRLDRVVGGGSTAFHSYAEHESRSWRKTSFSIIYDTGQLSLVAARIEGLLFAFPGSLVRQNSRHVTCSKVRAVRVRMTAEL